MSQSTVWGRWLGALSSWRRRSPMRSDSPPPFALIAAAVGGSRAVVWGAGLVAIARFPRDPAALLDPYRFTKPFHLAAANLLFAPTARWDSIWYLRIADHGYWSRPSTAFYPVFPLLIHVGSLVVPPVVAGALISLASMVVGFHLLYLLARLELGETAARLTVALIAVFPTALFFSAVYTESLFLALSVGAVYAARTDRWAWAGLLGAVASATRPNGILLAVPLVIIYLYGPRSAIPPTTSQRWWRPRYPIGRSALWLAVVPLGLIVYLGYLGLTMHDPTAPFHAEAYFGRQFAGPFGAVLHALEGLSGDIRQIVTGTMDPARSGDPLSLTIHSLIDLPFVAFAVAGLVFAWKRLPSAYAAYGVVLLAAVLSEPSTTEPLSSFPRYMLIAFPVFMGWASKASERASTRRWVLGTSTIGLVGFSWLWGIWAWVA